MKRITSLLFALVLLAACGGQNNSESNAMETYGCDVLNVYNWGEYIGENVIYDFEDRYGVRVNYSLFASNEEMYTKLLGGTKYDVIIPSDYMIEKLLDEDMLQPLDKEMITNIDNLYEGVLNKPYDPDNTYSIPYFWGNVGIVYDTTLIDTADVESQGWEVLRNKKYKDMPLFYATQAEVLYKINPKNPKIKEQFKKGLNLLTEKDVIAIKYFCDLAFVIKLNEEMIKFLLNIDLTPYLKIRLAGFLINKPNLSEKEIDKLKEIKEQIDVQDIDVDYIEGILLENQGKEIKAISKYEQSYNKKAQ